MDSHVIETVAKFFFFISLEEEVVHTASSKVLGELQKKNWTGIDNKFRWIQVMDRWRKKLPGLKARRLLADDSKSFTLPQGLDFGAWMTFIGSSEIQMAEIEAVLYSQVLGFEDSEIAKGLGISEGTVRYRVGRGLRHLGGYVES